MNKKLHVLFLCGWYPSKVLPTNGDFIKRHAEAVATCHKVTVLHIISDAFLTEKKRIEVTEINNVTAYIGYIKTTKNPFTKFLRYVAVYKEMLCNLTDFQIVHLNTLYPFGLFALHLKKTKKIPFIISEHWTGYHFPQAKKIGFFQKFISKIITKKAAFVCPVSDDLGNSMQKLGLKGTYFKVPNVVDTQLFVPKKNDQKEFTIVHISDLFDEHKNISDMLRVAKKLEDEIGFFTWKFIGGTSTKYEQLIQKLDFTVAKIEFINHIPQKVLVTHLQTATVFVLFSNYENLPCVILESFSCGVPVIASNVGGIAEYFPDDFGKLISPKNTNQLYANLKYYQQKNKQNSDKMHIYAVNNFSKLAVQKSFSKLYQQSLKHNF